jgi:hypothetical protein
MHYVVGAVVAYIVGIFTPGVARKLKAKFSSESKKGISLVEGEVRAAEADIKKKL